MMTVVLFVLGVVLLIGGSEMLVRGASRLAVIAGISPLVVGLTVVAFATSSPELAVCVRSALAGNGGLAVGNVVGSNILNVLLILGAAAVIAPLSVSQKLIRLDVPLMIGVSVLMALLARDGVVNRWDGGLLALIGVAYVAFSIRQSRLEGREVVQDYEDEFAVPVDERDEPREVLREVVFVAVGLALLVLGAQWMVDGAVVFARGLGVSDLLIGLTIVAMGTSLPEIATTVTASLKGERDVAIGNVIGSNLFNILFVMGLTALFAPGGVPVSRGALTFDLPVMIGVAVACLPVFFLGGRISRWEGALFLGYYAAYTAYLIMTAGQHSLLPALRAAMGFFVLPLTVVTLVGLMARERRMAPARGR